MPMGGAVPTPHLPFHGTRRKRAILRICGATFQSDRATNAPNHSIRRRDDLDERRVVARASCDGRGLPACPLVIDDLQDRTVCARTIVDVLRVCDSRHLPIAKGPFIFESATVRI